VAVAGKTIVAGASDDSQLGFASGAAHVYRHDGAAWIEQAKLMASDGEGGDRFGRAVSVGASERIVLVGASNDDAPDAESGSAYVFRLSDDAWGEAGRLTASDGGPSAKFGIALCLSGEAALIGATRGGLPGAAYAFIGFGGDDCNDNGVSDACDIAGGASDDENRDGVPDECQVPGDLDGDGVVDVTDLQALILGWGMCEEPCPPSCPADLDGDCRVGISDLITLILNWG
jgi:hypothetical protein